MKRKLMVTGVALALTCSSGVVAFAAGPDAGGYGDSYVFYNDWSGDIANEVTAGSKISKAFSGDWDGNGADQLSTRVGMQTSLYKDDSGDPPYNTFRYWTPNDEIISGDWNGDGITTFGVRRDSTFYLQNSFGDGQPDYRFDFGDPKALVLVGDFDGDGRDGIALRDGNQFTILDDVTSNVARNVTFGKDSAVDVVAVGDWTGNGIDTPLVRDGNTYYAYNSWDYDTAPIYEVTIGGSHNAVLVGDWDGDGRDTLALRNFTFKPTTKGQTTQTQTSALVDTPEFRLRADAAASWERVTEIWGKALQVNSGWRPFETQRSIFLSRYTPRAKGQGGGEFCDVRTWDGTQYVRTSPLGAAAVPGTSNHGSGLAIDVGGFDGFGDPMRLKFLDLARDFGWNDAEGCSVGENWHLVYNPAADKGSTNWSPDDPIDKSASHCPDKTTGAGTVVPPSACKWG